jgi:hypothetical protein
MLTADADNKCATIDSTIVCAHQHSAGSLIDRKSAQEWGLPLKCQQPADDSCR